MRKKLGRELNSFWLDSMKKLITPVTLFLLSGVAWAITVNPASNVTADSAATAFTIPYRDGSGNIEINVLSGTAIDASSASGVCLRDDSSTAGVCVEDGGQVGVGVTDPTQLFEIRDTGMDADGVFLAVSLSSGVVSDVDNGGTAFGAFSRLFMRSSTNNLGATDHIAAFEGRLDEEVTNVRTTEYGVIGRVDSKSTNTGTAFTITGVGGLVNANIGATSKSDQLYVGVTAEVKVTDAADGGGSAVSSGSVRVMHIKPVIGGDTTLNKVYPLYQEGARGFNYFGSSVGINVAVPLAALALPSQNDATTPTLCFGDNDCDTGLYENQDDDLSFANNGNQTFLMNALGAFKHVISYGQDTICAVSPGEVGLQYRCSDCDNNIDIVISTGTGSCQFKSLNSGSAWIGGDW